MAVKACPPPSLTMTVPANTTPARKLTPRKPKPDKTHTQEPVETEAKENDDDGIEEIDCMDYLSPTEEMRENVRVLLQVSEFYSNLITHHPHERPYDFIDVICGWESTAPCPVYAASATSPSVVKKRKSKTLPDFDRRYSTKNDDDSFTEPLRRSVSEADTYRYIPNNGRYRLGKERRKACAPVRVETNYTFMPKRMSLTEQRLLQRQARLDRRADNVVDYDEDPGCHVTSHVVTEPRETRVDDPNDKNPALKDGFHPSPQIRGGTKLNFRKKEKTMIVTPPSDKTQDPNLLSKAFTDTIMKNFTSKISAIEEQIRGEANWWAMAAGGATYLENSKGKRSNSLPMDSIKIMPVSKTTLPLRPLQKVPSNSQAIQPKVFGASGTGPQNTPRYNYLESYILNPLNLEAARPKATKSDTATVRQTPKERAKRRSREESAAVVDNLEDRGDRGFQASPIGKPNPRGEKRSEGEDIIAPVALPELFGKKLEVTVSAQKWL